MTAQTSRTNEALSDLDHAVDLAESALRVLTDLDWSVRAGTLTWSCRTTLTHVTDCHLSYALLVTGQATSGFLKAATSAPPDARPSDLVDTMRASGRVLSAVLRDAPVDQTVWHLFGQASISGVARMGVIETLVHTWDVAQGLRASTSHPSFTPEDDLCGRTVAMMFPGLPTAVVSTYDAWSALLWATGRLSLPEVGRRPDWQWVATAPATSARGPSRSAAAAWKPADPRPGDPDWQLSSSRPPSRPARPRAVVGGPCQAGHMAYDEDLADRLRVALSQVDGVTEKEMFGGLAFLVGGHLAVSASGRGGLLLRCDPAETDALVRQPEVGRFEMRGREMDGWLRVDPKVVASDEELGRWVEVGVAYTLTLPPK